MANNSKLTNSKYILDQIKLCIDDNIEIFDATTGSTKGGKPGRNLQNFLRGTILLACAGLDAFLKQLLKDALIDVKRKNEISKVYFQKVVQNQIKNKKIEEGNGNSNQFIQEGATFIAQSLLSDDPRQFVESFVLQEMLTDSKQSYESLRKIAQAFGLKIEILTTDEKNIRLLFKMRNEISHEFDVEFKNTKGSRNRRDRSRSLIITNTTLLYKVCTDFYNMVDAELSRK